MNYPPTRDLNPEERDLIWKYRFYLTREKRGLTKFLKSAVMIETIEEKSLQELVDKWVPIDIADSLELFGETLNHPLVRSYAVKQLERADDQVYFLFFFFFPLF